MPLFWEWCAYYRIAPWGDAWRRAGRLASHIAASSGAKVEGGEIGDIEESFMPTGGKYRGMNQTEIEMLRELRKIPAIREQIDRRR